MSSEPSPLAPIDAITSGYESVWMAGMVNASDGSLALAGCPCVLNTSLPVIGAAVGLSICSDLRKTAVAPCTAPAAGMMRVSTGFDANANTPMSYDGAKFDELPSAPATLRSEVVIRL